MRAGLRYIAGNEWTMLWATILAVGTELPALAAALEGDLEQAGDKLTPMGFVTLVVGVVIRSNLWARRQEARAAESDSEGIGPALRPVPDLHPEPRQEPDVPAWLPRVVAPEARAEARDAAVPPLPPNYNGR